MDTILKGDREHRVPLLLFLLTAREDLRCVEA
jgi:hypothetical protein